MISNKEAIQKAITYIKDIYDNPNNILLEEIELSEDGVVWLITLSFDSPIPLNAFAAAIGSQRVYKVIEIFTRDGEVRSMKIRKV